MNFVCWISTPLKGLLTCDELANVPFLVLGNKIDIPRACSEDELRNALGLYETYGKETKPDARRQRIRSRKGTIGPWRDAHQMPCSATLEEDRKRGCS